MEQPLSRFGRLWGKPALFTWKTRCNREKFSQLRGEPRFWRWRVRSPVRDSIASYWLRRSAVSTAVNLLTLYGLRVSWLKNWEQRYTICRFPPWSAPLESGRYCLRIEIFVRVWKWRDHRRAR